MIKRIIEVFSSIDDEWICDFEIDKSWTADKLHSCFIEYDEKNPFVYGTYKLTAEQIKLLGGAHLLEINDGNADFFLSYEV